MDSKRKKIIYFFVAIIIVMIFNMTIVHAYPFGSRTLRPGNVGSDVKELQVKLTQWGYFPGHPDGIYGGSTKEAIRKFQKDQRLKVDGIAGWETIKRLKQIKFTTYYVKPGETLSTIAEKFNTTVWKIKINNNLVTDVLYVGEKLKIPQSGPKRYSTYRSNPVTRYRINVNDEELDLLARAVYSEARGESYKGQVAVAAVVINRVQHPRFPNNVKAAIFEPWAFTAVHDGQFWLQPDQEAYKAARDALKGWDPSGGATFYYNPAKVTSNWIYSRPIITKIGNHYFAS